MIEYLIRCDLEDLEIEINKGEVIGKSFTVSIFILRNIWINNLITQNIETLENDNF